MLFCSPVEPTSFLNRLKGFESFHLLRPPRALGQSSYHCPIRCWLVAGDDKEQVLLWREPMAETTVMIWIGSAWIDGDRHLQPGVRFEVYRGYSPIPMTSLLCGITHSFLSLSLPSPVFHRLLQVLSEHDHGAAFPHSYSASSFSLGLSFPLTGVGLSGREQTCHARASCFTPHPQLKKN